MNRELSRYAGEPGWYDSDKVRFRHGKPEKIGGWQNVNGIGDTTTFSGVARAMHNWTANDGTAYTAIGTSKKLHLWAGGAFYDITPVRASATTSIDFQTSTSSSVVNVSLTSHGGAVGDFVIFTSLVPASVAGIDLNAEWTLTTVVDSHHFQFESSTVATGNAIVSALGRYNFLLSPGNVNSSQGFGWGAGGWGHSGGWGGEAPAGTAIGLRTWTLDNWGEDLVAAPRGGAIYQWKEDDGTSFRASAVPGAPTQTDFLIVSQEDRHLFAIGTLDALTSTYDPLYLRWSSSENLNDWTASATNTAGDKRFSGASKCLGALRSRGQILVFTEDGLHGIQFAGGDFVFNFQNLGQAAGLTGPHAAAEINGRTYWMAAQKFMVYDGAAPRPLDSTVLRFVFDNLDATQIDKIYAGINEGFNEIIWLYQSLSSPNGDIDRYVTHNYVENTWAIGTLTRTAWADRAVYAYPIAADVSGQLFYHEIGFAADGSAMSSYLESADFDLGDGQEIMFLDRIIPDFTARDGSRLPGTVYLMLEGKKYPAATTITKGPFTVTGSTEKVAPRLRARQVNLRVEASCSTGWRMGALRVRAAPDGRE